LYQLLHEVIHESGLGTGASVDLHQRSARGTLAKMVAKLFDHWELPPRSSDPVGCARSRATIARYRRGEPLADSADLLARAGTFGNPQSFAHHFPHDLDLAYRWIRTPNRRFGGQPPVDIMKQGFEGLLAVRRYLTSSVAGNACRRSDQRSSISTPTFSQHQDNPQIAGAVDDLSGDPQDQVVAAAEAADGSRAQHLITPFRLR
jgi:hypothetical protein